MGSRWPSSTPGAAAPTWARLRSAAAPPWATAGSGPTQATTGRGASRIAAKSWVGSPDAMAGLSIFKITAATVGSAITDSR